MGRQERKDSGSETEGRAPVILNRIQEIVCGDRDCERELIDTFLESNQEHFIVLDSALRSMDATVVEHEAHSIKGASGNMGAEQMEKLAKAIEDFGERGDLDSALEVFDSLKAEFERVRRYLEEYLKDMENK